MAFEQGTFIIFITPELGYYLEGKKELDQGNAIPIVDEMSEFY